MFRKLFSIRQILFFILPLSVMGQDTLNGNAGNSGAGKDIFVKDINITGRDMSQKTKTVSDPNCTEQGVVVMAITVDRAGNVIEAVAGRGSTNLAPCLVEQAKAAALKTKFNPDPNAPEKQWGSIKYNFKLTD